MSSLAFDLRDALRAFRRDRTYAATVILTLALTIGATTAVFSIVNGVLLAPLEYPEASRLVSLREVWREQATRIATFEVNERHFDYWRAHARSFDALAQYIALPANLTGQGDAAQIRVAQASGSLFDVLQVRAAAGRTIAVRDEPRDAPDVATISDRLWRERFGADPRAIGRAIILDGTPYTIVGILPAGFRLPERGRLAADVDAFVPLRIRPTLGWVGDHNDQAIGRLRAGVTIAQARAELDALQAQVGEIATKEAHEPVTLASAVAPLAEYIVGRARLGLLLLMAAIVSVLLIACANLANLSLTRTLGRLREAAIRAALGASRARLLRRAVLEQLVLSAIGGAFGLWVAWAALALFVRTAPLDLPRAREVTLDARILAFAAAVSILAGLLVAIVPALRIARRDLQAALRAGATAVASDRGSLRSHAALLALQVGLSVTLLVVTALLAASFVRVLHVDRGFDADRVLAVDIALPAARYQAPPVQQAAFDRLLASVSALPGVTGASTMSMLPLAGQGQVNSIAPEGNTRPTADLPNANFRFVAPDFFRTLGVTIKMGRSFTERERDPDRPLPALLSEPAAASLWPNENPIGKRFNRGQPGERSFEVVGVVGDARMTSLDRTPPLMVYVPYWWQARTTTSLLIKTAIEPSALLPDVRRAIHAIDPDIAIGATRPLDRLVDAALAGRRYQTQLFVAFGLVALLIATIGVYAVTSYGASRRRREMNIRVALGAQRSQVIGLMLRQGALPVIAGVAAGAAGALALGGSLESLLFDVRARDPLIVIAVIAVVSAVSLATCGFAARRGLTINPAKALREE